MRISKSSKTDVKAAKSAKTNAKATTKGFDMGTSPTDTLRDKLVEKGYDREELEHMGLVGLEDLAEKEGIDIRACNSSTDTDKALQHIKAAIDILGKSGKKDDITKDSIANLATVMFDIKGRK